MTSPISRDRSATRRCREDARELCTTHRLQVDALTTPRGLGQVGDEKRPQLPKALSREIRPHPGERAPTNEKAPPCGAFASCAEEDSNLHPVIPDQALNLVTRVSDTSESRQIVRSVRESGRCGRIGRCGCCRRCCHERATSHDREVAPCPVGAVTDRGLDALAASPGGCRGRLTVSDRRRPRLRNPGSASNRPNRGPR